MDIQDILDLTDEQGFDDIDEDLKLHFINMAIEDIAAEAPWPYLEATLTVDASSDIDQATGEIEGLTGVARAILKIINTDSFGRKVSWIRRDEHLEAHGSQLADTGDASRYFTFGEKWYVWPIPASGTYVIDYLQLELEVDADTTESEILLPARKHEAILLRTLYRLYMQDEDLETAGGFKAQYDEYLVRMREDLFKKQYDRPDRIFMIDEDDYTDDFSY